MHTQKPFFDSRNRGYQLCMHVHNFENHAKSISNERQKKEYFNEQIGPNELRNASIRGWHSFR